MNIELADDPDPQPDSTSQFHRVLHRALADGRPLPAEARFGPGTRAAVNQLAQEHPYAPTELINSAFDAFDREHRTNHYPYPT